MQVYGWQLMHINRLAVHGLKNPDILPPRPRIMQAHVAYGVEEKHYAAVGNALMLPSSRGWELTLRRRRKRPG
jgi:hypothetical protein